MGGMGETQQKGGKLVGGAATEEALLSSKSVLSPNRAGRTTGLQQYFSPEVLSTFIASITGTGHQVLDLGAGGGHLLSAFDKASRYGVELDEDQVRSARFAHRGYCAIQGDVQHVFPLLRGLGVKVNLTVCNPAFGLEWVVPGLGKGSSTELTVRMMDELLADGGLGVLVCGKERFEREVRPLLGERLFAVIEVERLFPGVKLSTAVAFWRKAEVEKHWDGKTPTPPPLEVTVATVEALTGTLAHEVRERHAERFPWWNTYPYSRSGHNPMLANTFATVQEEHQRRTAARLGRAAFTAALRGGKRIAVSVSGFTRLALEGAKKREAIGWLETFHGQTTSYFALQNREWLRLRALSEDEALGVTLEPALVAAVEEAIRSARRAGVPLYPIAPAQRLGFLDNLDRVHCRKEDVARGFVAGTAYALDCKTAVLKKEEVKDRQTVRDGVVQSVPTSYLVERKAMEIQIGEQKFTESAEDITYLLEHFDIPDPGDIEQHFPQEVAFWRSIIQRIELEVRARVPGFRFRDFQLEDMARLLVKGGGVLAWEQGLGKSNGQAMMVRALELAGRVPDECALFVMPQDLVQQFAEATETFFGRKLVLVGNVQQALAVRRQVELRRAALRRGDTSVPGLWAVTWFEALAVSGREVEEMPLRVVRHLLDRTAEIPEHMEWSEKKERQVKVKAVPSKQVRVPLTSAAVCPECFADAGNGWGGGRCEARLRYPNGKPSQGRRKVCGYVDRRLRVKPAYSILSRTFRTICIDEGTKIAGDDSLTSKAVRALRAEYRLLATGTPIKNFVSQLYWLLWWALGDSSARFPYSYNGGRELFDKDFAVIETRKDDETGKKTGRPRTLPEVTNLARLWKMLGSSVVRRRMDEVGALISEDGEWTCKACKATHQEHVRGPRGEWIHPSLLECSACAVVADAVVPLKYVPVRVPMGVAQLTYQAAWLNKTNFVRHFKAKFPDHPLVRAKNGDALITLNAACLGQLAKLGYAAIDPTGDPDSDYQGPGLSPWTPGRLEVLRLAEKSVREGKRVVIGSCHVAVGAWLAAELCKRGVRAIHITDTDANGKVHTIAPKKRAKLLGDFRNGRADVACVSAQSVALGHNFDVASVFIGYGLPWDHSGWDQLLKRVRRLSSRAPVTAYIILPVGSVEERKWKGLQDKNAAADLALDGKVIARREAAVDFAEVLEQMQRAGASFTGNEVPEAQVKEMWERSAQAA